ncbi:MAG: triose-phosphate isomerase [Pseudanabaenaceae cyanobacterium bins.68]|nr:triose-phosphate isomerase [Pseudanabaenaceae cyanobacterium bins.68]
MLYIKTSELNWNHSTLPTIVIAGNWKMYKTQSEAKTFLQEFSVLAQPRPGSEVVIFAPFTALPCLAIYSANQPQFALGAQNIHWAEQGAFTGEIAAPMLVELGVKYTIVGHSERRQYFGETDQTVNLRLKAAQAAGITPILCVGETKTERDQGQTEQVIIAQLQTGLVGVDQTNLVIAYEPIWAIGTGETCAAPEANRVIGVIRAQLQNQNLTIQYGGSVKPDNIAEIMAQPQINGVLVGGASLDAQGFAQIVNF